jgi:hypothetical protein
MTELFEPSSHLDVLMAKLLNGRQICASYQPADTREFALRRLRDLGYEIAMEKCHYTACRHMAYYIPAIRLARVLEGRK